MTKEELKNKLLGFAASVAESNGTCISNIVDFWSEYIYKELPHWTSVNDELPNENVVVLTINDRGGVSMGYYTDDEWRNIMFPYKKSSIPVTHWMPLPSVEHLKKGKEK